jgi:hypothetical protein
MVVTMVSLAAACGPDGRGADAPTSSRHGDEHGVLEKLARELDPGPQSAIFPQLQADVRAKVKTDAPHELAPAARLVAARDRISRWTIQLSTTDPDSLGVQLDRAFEGVYLAEPLALAPISGEAGPTNLEARALLWRFYSAFIGTEPLLRTFATSWGGAGKKLATALAAMELFKSVGAKMTDRFAAEILRARAPEPTVADILWSHASRKLAQGDAAGGRALYAEYLRRSGSSESFDDQLRVAQAHIRLEDAGAAAIAVARAKATAQRTPGDRTAQARVRSVERDREMLVRLLALPSDKAPATQLARFDLLLELDRTKEGEALLAGLLRERPKDARVRARAVQLRVRNAEISEHLVDQLRGEELTDRTAEYWSMRIGAAGIAVAKAPSKSALGEIKAAEAELARQQPGRAAALSFIVDRVARLLEATPETASLVASLGPMLDEGLALRARFPAEPDVDRIVIALSLFATDPARGLAVALVRPKIAPSDDVELYEQRARTAVTLAAYVGKSADLAAVRAAVEDVPPSTAGEVEGGREALLGDVDVLAALMKGERAAWPRAVAHYETAKKTSKDDRARLDNNLGFAAALGGDAARATALFDASARARSGRRWVPVLNVSTAAGTSKTDQLAAVRTIAAGLSDAESVGLVNAWRAFLEPGAGEANAAAAKALAEFDGPFATQKLALNAQGIETEGSFSLGLGLRSGLLGHTLSASAYATLWLVRPMPLSRAELDAKTKAGPPRPPPP